MKVRKYKLCPFSDFIKKSLVKNRNNFFGLKILCSHMETVFFPPETSVIHS